MNGVSFLLFISSFVVFHFTFSNALFYNYLGTRIIYERKFLLELRNSPLSRTPPQNLPMIPGVTCDAKLKPGVRKDNGIHGSETECDKNDNGEVPTQFEMDI